jgi:NADH-quinone oxidoreductase subunit J
MQSSQILPLVGFYFFALLTVISAVVVVFARSIMRAVFSLMFTLFGVAGLYISLHADFLAATQVLIYVGGVLVILIFGIMLTQRLVEADLRSGRIQLVPTLIAVAILFVFLMLVIFNTPWNIQGPAQFQNTTMDIGTLLMTEWLLPFEVASILLLAALVGAVGIARTRRTTE